MIRRVISTQLAPAAIGPYSQATLIDQTLHLSGQIGLDPATMEMAGADVESQTEQALKNMGAVLQAGGSSFSQVVSTTVLLTDMANFSAVNQIYAKYFPKPYPSRACYAVQGLPKNALVEITAIAVSGELKDV